MFYMFLLCSGIYEGYNFTDYTSSVGILPSQAAASSCFQGFEDCSRIPRREHSVTLNNLGEFMKESHPFHLGVLGCNAWLIFSLHHNSVDSAWEQETHVEISSHLVQGPKFPIWESSHKSASCVVSSSMCQVFQDHFFWEQELTSFVYLASEQ